MYFAAVEVKRGSPEDAIRDFIMIAAELGIRFKKLQTYGPIEVARFQFVRFQTDCPTFLPIASRMIVDERGIIVPTKAGYKAHLPNGREGSVNFTLMHGVARPGFGKVYMGPSHQHWQAQFTPGSA